MSKDCPCAPRNSLTLPLLAVPEEVPRLRRVLQLHLCDWNLPHVVDAAQLCATELLANVIHHVGPGNPVTLTTAMRGTHVRLALRDPGSTGLPTLGKPDEDDEAGRGLMLIDAVAAGWGIVLHDHGKTIWVELSTALGACYSHIGASASPSP